MSGKYMPTYARMYSSTVADEFITVAQLRAEMAQILARLGGRLQRGEEKTIPYDEFMRDLRARRVATGRKARPHVRRARLSR